MAVGYQKSRAELIRHRNHHELLAGNGMNGSVRLFWQVSGAALLQWKLVWTVTSALRPQTRCNPVLLLFT